MPSTDAPNARRSPAVIPNFCYEDVGAAIRFLVDVLGFHEDEVNKEPDGSVTHAQLSWDDGLIMVSPSQEGSPYSLGPSVTYMTLDDPDAHFERVTAAGEVGMVMGLTDQPYGSREFAVRDAEGNVWCFGTYRPIPGPRT
jgi:uncharacterized glyoxalase superfamily protein PhnB